MGAKYSSSRYPSNMNFRNQNPNTNSNASSQLSAQNNASKPAPASDHRISLDEVYESLEDYKEVINNVYSLNTVLDEYSLQIQQEWRKGNKRAINDVLCSSLHDDYNYEEGLYCEIIELTKQKNDVNHCKMLFSCKRYPDVDNMSVLDLKTTNSSQTIENIVLPNMGKLLEHRILEMSKRLPAYGDQFLHAGLGVWTQGVRCYFNLLRKHPVFPDKWIMISSGIDMKEYTEQNILNLNKFSAEYKILLENITQVMNSNMHINLIEKSAVEASKGVDEAIVDSEEKIAAYNFARKVFDTNPRDEFAKAKLQDASMAAQTASRLASTAASNAKQAKMALAEAEAAAAQKTTTWEYGPSESHEELRCVYSGIHPQWNGRLIADCNIHGNNLDIPAITFSVMTDMETNYSEFFHNQMILCTYRTNAGHHLSLVKVMLRDDDKIHIQMKEASLNTMFSTTPTENTDMNSTTHHNTIDKFVFIDPSSNYIGISTDEKRVEYTENYVTTKKDNAQHVVVKSKHYPNFVATRVAEHKKHVQNNDYYYFDQFSASTMRRQSDLYSFDDMVKYAEKGSDGDGMRRYGSDISFEVTDKTKKTSEIGSIGMVIDKIDEDGTVFGGISVKSTPEVVVEEDGKEMVQPGNTIMYVSSAGTLHISGIMLGDQLLQVKTDEEGKQSLFWGENQVA